MPVDLRAFPDVSPRVVRLMLGEPASSMLAYREAEDFAFLVLGQTVAPYSPIATRRAARQLQPLHAGLLQAVPRVAAAAGPGRRVPARFRLHRQVVQIRDAMLALRPYRDPQVARAATAAVRADGLAGADLAAAVEAAVLAAAVRARIGGHLARTPASTTDPVTMAGVDLRDEASWLVKVARAWTRQQDTTPSPRRRPGNQHTDCGPSMDGPQARLR